MTDLVGAPLPLLRSSERSTLKQCPQKWWYAYREGLIPIGPDRGARWFGICWHIVMAEWYIPGRKRGRPMEETWEELMRDSHETIRVVAERDDDLVTYEKAKELGFDLIRQYRRQYGTDEHMDVIVPERRFKVLIPNPKQLDVPIAEHVGTWDLVYRDLNDGHIKIMDHKTCGRIEYGHLVLDDQKGSYIALGTHALRQEGIIGPREFIRGMEYNFVRKAKMDVRPEDEFGNKLNKDGSISKRQPTRNLERYFVQMSVKERNKQILRLGAEVELMNRFRKREIPVWKTPTRNCPYCDFFDLCELDEIGEDQSTMMKMGFKRRDPYFDHREGAVNSKISVSADRWAKEKATIG